MKRALLAVTALLAVAGCGTPSADLFVVNRSGTIPGAKLELHVSDGGYVTCNGGAQMNISSQQLIDARAMLHELEGDNAKGGDDGVDGPIDRDLKLAPKPGSTLTYEVRGEEGTVRFSDNSVGQPQVFYELARFTRAMAKDVCGLPR